MVFEITDSAAGGLLGLLREKDASPEAQGLRLSVERGGCAGLQYAMAVAEPMAGDHIFEHGGVRVFVEAGSAGHLEGCTLDYSDGLSGAGFRIVNPRAARSCGCGTSFEPTA